MIAGASAGGYTALAAAARTTTFAAATARSAIIDPLHWQQNTTSLQRHHAGSLVGPDGDSIAGLANELRVPVLLIHGAKTAWCLLTTCCNSSKNCVAATALARWLVLPGEGHTIRGPRHIEQALEAELNHYLAVLDPTRIGD